MRINAFTFFSTQNIPDSIARRIHQEIKTEIKPYRDNSKWVLLAGATLVYGYGALSLGMNEASICSILFSVITYPVIAATFSLAELIGEKHLQIIYAQNPSEYFLLDLDATSASPAA